jgi:cobalt-zinc-cadmium efflux system membrane fusion protein
MIVKRTLYLVPVCLLLLAALGCHSKSDPGQEAPPKASVEKQGDVNVVSVAHPESFQLVAVTQHDDLPALNVTGSVSPDISREIPVISLANGRVVNIRVRLGDTVRKGQPLMEVQSADVSAAMSTYIKAMNDERLARVQLERARVLYEKGATSKSQLEIAENNEQDAAAAVEAAEQQLRVLGVDKNHPSEIVEIRSPASGVIITQNVTAASAAGATLSGSPNAFVIADLSHVWVLCDVFENDLAAVKLGDTAEIRLSAFPDRTFKGRISDIGPILDPSIRTAKVRIEIANPGNIMRVGMFATATFYGKQAQHYAAVPSTAVLHLHDRDWVYLPAGNGRFRRQEVRAARMLPGDLQEITSGLNAGDQVVSKALELQNSAEQQ